ncbi:hypothetical protein GQ55_9G224300 [Panicum hallii var. hallii]|uniref:Exostosin GT47 domain-containing protein n=1 Tax=Panicum hallii var. hallii TaxID=1504633 RepID=A0A2T7C616_9POAL|nr:hypothetical protein GQ55_9G224300 [Panicum hallii var. hallii]
MKSTTVGPSFQKDAADKPDAAAGGVLWPSRACYLVALATAFWAVASILFQPSPFSLPLLPSVTVSQHPPHEQPPPLFAGQALAQSNQTVAADRCAGRYIYVYDLPPRFNDDIVRGCRALRPWMDMCPYMPNCGMGRPLGAGGGAFPGRGWFATDQFMLDVIVRCRMRRYACLTADPARAAAVFVPAYASLDGGRHLWNGTATRDALAADLVAWLARRPEWRAADGRDHFLAAGRTAWDFLRKTDDDGDWGTKLLNLPAVRKMTALVLEVDPWHRSATIAVPYPTYFHPAAAADVRDWQAKARAAERRWLFSFAGAARPGSNRTVRAEIFQQCGASSRCGMFRCAKGSECESSPGAVMRLFESSVFCLQPRGDTATRRSTFDAVLAGCIPVFFHPDSAYTQYTAHLPPDPASWSVLIMHTDVTDRNVSIEETLARIPPETVRAMREEVIRLIPKLVYADPRSARVDFKDAFDIAVEAVLDRVAKRRRGDVVDVEGR